MCKSTIFNVDKQHNLVSKTFFPLHCKKKQATAKLMKFFHSHGVVGKERKVTAKIAVDLLRKLLLLNSKFVKD